MNQLQKYIKIKGLTVCEVAKRTGLGYHIVHKTIKGLRYGDITRRKIAEALILDYTKTWSSFESGPYLKHLINLEIERNANRARAEKREKLKALFLGESEIKQNVSNI